MAGPLAIQNNLIVLKNGLLSECCCNDQPFYWEAIPCNWNELPRERCGPYPGCGDLRKFVDIGAVCEGTVNVCECQQLTIPGWTSLSDNDSTAFNIQLLANYANTTGIINDTSFTLRTKYVPTSTIYSNTFNYSSYANIDALINAINSYAPGGTSAVSLLNYLIHPSSLADSMADSTVLLNAAPDASYIANRPGNIAFTFEGNTTSYVNFISDETTFAASIQQKLINMGVNCIITQDNALLSDPIFYIIFQGDRCGSEQENITLKYRWLGTFSQPANPPRITYGDYVTGWGQEGTNYVTVPSGGESVTCLYEDAFYNGNGYGILQDGFQCCPQRGTTVGANQVYPGRTEYGSDFEYLENTFVDTDGCYKLNPFFFLVGKEGRFTDDPRTSHAMFTQPGCNYVGSGCSDHSEWYNIPENGQLELFIPQFSHEVPWGPFGSYSNGLEDRDHPANNSDYLGHTAYTNNVKGWHYSPTGMMRTRGTWTNTTGVILEFAFYSWAPFDMQIPGSLNRFNGTLKKSTLSSRFSILREPCCSGTSTAGSCAASGANTWVLAYDPVGTHVWQFIQDVNAIRIRTTSGITTDALECQLFNFCPMGSSGDLAAIPATKMNNLSSQLFDAWKAYGNSAVSYLIDDPDRDAYGFSGASIRPRPTHWNDKLADSANNSDRTYTYPDTLFAPASTSRVLHPPQASRMNVYPHEDSFNGVIRHNCRPAWYTMAGQERTVVTLSKNTINYDPDTRNVTVEVSGTFINIIVSSGATTLASTGWQTQRSSGSYTQSDLTNDLNNLTFKWYNVPASSYNPVVATSGTAGFKIYIDDVSYASSGQFLDPSGRRWFDYPNNSLFDAASIVRTPGLPGQATVPNYGYREPLLPLSTTDITLSSVNLTSWVRARSTGIYTDNCGSAFPSLLAPFTATKLTATAPLNCDGDNYVVGNWLVNFGCNSYYCKTEWYIQAQRCGCSDLPSCGSNGGLSYVTHPTNTNDPTDCSKLQTPTFYMCESNLYEECTIPFLIKVPSMFTCRQGNDNCWYQYNNGSCWSDPYENFPCTVPVCPYNDPENLEDRSSIQIGFTNPYHGCPASSEIDFACWMNRPYDDWCQYIDPTNLQRVRKQDIPRSWPPEAIVLESTEVQFCPSFVNLFDADIGNVSVGDDGVIIPTSSCGDPINQSNPYDALVGLIPWVPFDYLIPAGQTGEGKPCFMAGENYLYAYIRPIVKNYDASGLCGGGCYPVSVDCNTRCCRCGEACAVGCELSNPQRGCTISTSISQESVDITTENCQGRIYPPGTPPGTPGACNWALLFACANSQWGCPCMDLTLTTTKSFTFSKTETTTTTLGYRKVGEVCVAVTFNPGCCVAIGDSEITTNYTGNCQDPCFWKGCGTAPSDVCFNPEQACIVITETPLDCSFDPIGGLGWSVGGTTTDTVTLDPGRCNSPVVYGTIDNTTVRTYSDSVGSCGAGTVMATETIDSVADLSPGGGCAFREGDCICSSWDLGSPAKIFVGSLRDYTNSITSTATAETCSNCNFDSISGNATTDYDAIIASNISFSCGNPANVRTTETYPPTDKASDLDWRCTISDDTV